MLKIQIESKYHLQITLSQCEKLMPSKEEKFQQIKNFIKEKMPDKNFILNLFIRIPKSARERIFWELLDLNTKALVKNKVEYDSFILSKNNKIGI